jgi:hypothetical protein
MIELFTIMRRSIDSYTTGCYNGFLTVMMRELCTVVRRSIDNHTGCCNGFTTGVLEAMQAFIWGGGNSAKRIHPRVPQLRGRLSPYTSQTPVSNAINDVPMYDVHTVCADKLDYYWATYDVLSTQCSNSYRKGLVPGYSLTTYQSQAQPQCIGI